MACVWQQSTQWTNAASFSIRHTRTNFSSYIKIYNDFYQEKSSANVVFKMSAILFRPQCNNHLTHWPLGDWNEILESNFQGSSVVDS